MKLPNCTIAVNVLNCRLDVRPGILSEFQEFPGTV